MKARIPKKPSFFGPRARSRGRISTQARKFPELGMPYFVLLDSFGKIAFPEAGPDESSLRTAVAALTSSSTSQPKTAH